MVRHHCRPALPSPAPMADCFRRDQHGSARASQRMHEPWTMAARRAVWLQPRDRQPVGLSEASRHCREAASSPACSHRQLVAEVCTAGTAVVMAAAAKAV